MKHGFTLIEVLIASAIASLLLVALFFSFGQLNNSVTKASDTTDIFEAALLVDRVMFKDILGVFIPVQAVPAKKSKKATEAKKTDEKTAKDKTDTAKASAAKKDEEKKDEKQSKVPLLKDPFKGSNKGEQMFQLTFITANPSRVYWSEKTGEPKPSCVRVVYTLEEKKDRKKKEPRYQLYRQEGIKLDLPIYLKEGEIERYLIADNIVSCKLTFIAAIEKEKEKEENADAQKQSAKKEPAKEKKPEIELKTFNEWTVGKDEKDVRTRVMIPDTVVMTLVLSNAAETRERSFTLRFPVAARFNEVPEQEAPRSVPAAQQADKKPDAGAAQDKEKKEALANGANKIVQNLRTRFGQA